MTQHVICRSLSVAYALLGKGGWGGGGGGGGGRAAIAARGAAFHTRWGAATPPKPMLDPGLHPSSM